MLSVDLNYTFLNKLRALCSYLVLIFVVFKGALSWMVIVPLDVIKSRIQADDVKNPQYKVFTCNASVKSS